MALDPLFALGPALLIAALALLPRLYRARRTNLAARWLWLGVLIPPTALGAGRLATAGSFDWLTPGYAALCVASALIPWPPRLLALSVPFIARSALVIGILGLGLSAAWLRFPIGPQLFGARYSAEHDPANDRYVWPPALGLVEEEIGAAERELGTTPVLLGPHPSICAQLDIGFDGTLEVGCQTARRDGYAHWLPAASWRARPVLLYVTDSRFAQDPAHVSADHTATRLKRRVVERDGYPIREVFVVRLEQLSTAERHEATPTSLEARLFAR